MADGGYGGHSGGGGGGGEGGGSCGEERSKETAVNAKENITNTGKSLHL
mgnify:CR=1 FL=1